MSISPISNRIAGLLRAGALVLALVACERPGNATSSAPPSPAPFGLTASVQDLMAGDVDPAADFLWEAVGTVVDETGVHERRPQTQEEWEQMRYQAVRLIEATNLLAMEGRRMVAEGRRITDEGVDGVLTTEEAQRRIELQRPVFVSFARELHDVAQEQFRAIEARNVPSLLESGETMDEICEGCHLTFWYPDQVIPPPPVFDDSGKLAPPPQS